MYMAKHVLALIRTDRHNRALPAFHTSHSLIASIFTHQYTGFGNVYYKLSLNRYYKPYTTYSSSQQSFGNNIELFFIPLVMELVSIFLFNIFYTY